MKVLEETYLNTCPNYTGLFGPIFHIGNAILGIAFVVPQGIPLSFLLLRAFATCGLLVLLNWSHLNICSGQSFLFYLIFVLINATYLLILAARHFPVFLPRHLKDLYHKHFLPLKVSKKEFCHLIKDATFTSLKAGDYFCVENQSKIVPKLHLLMSGCFVVKSDGIILHKVEANEFLDSVEWRAMRTDALCRKYQVTVQAEEDCRILVLRNVDLERAFEVEPKLSLVLDCLIGKDITKKLYTTSDLVSSIVSESPKANESPAGIDASGRFKGSMKKLLDFHRTLSLDSIHTGCKGLVRSKDWMKKAAIRTVQHEAVQDHVLVVNFELDIPPSMSYLPNKTPIHTIEKEILAEAQFLASQRKYWPTGFI